MNTNGQSTDNLNDESHKMTSWMHQMMSQGNQVVETTLVKSQGNLTEINLRLSTRSQNATQSWKRLLPWFLVSLPLDVWKGIAG